MIRITYAEVDGTTKNDSFDEPATSQVFDGGRAIVLLHDDRRVTGWAQYTRVSRIVAGSAAQRVGAEEKPAEQNGDNCAHAE